MIARITYAAAILVGTTAILWLVWRTATLVLDWPDVRPHTVALAVFMVWFAVAAYGVASEESR